MVKILIAATLPGFREDLGQALETKGFEIFLAKDCIRALAAIKKQSPDFVIVDVHLHGGSGFDILKFCKKKYASSKVMLFGPSTSLQHAVKALSLGALNFLNQELELSVLSKEVKRLIKKNKIIEPIKGDSPEEKPKQGAQKSKAAPKKKIIGASSSLTRVFDLVEKIKAADSTVLISGPSGTGKELIARAIHESSPMKKGPWVPVNCGAIPETLLESELFGHVKGSFTGAQTTRKGRFALAENGTIFLDEIGEISLAMQVKLLRVLQEKEFIPVGGEESHYANFRVIAATNKNLEQEVDNGNFREDLYYRLNVIPIEMPSLKDRTEDIPELVDYFIQRFNELKSSQITGVSLEAIEMLQCYHWPGNIRELENIMERMIVLRGDGEVGLEDIPPKISAAYHSKPSSKGFDPFSYVRDMGIPDNGVDLQSLQGAMESHLICLAMDKTGGNRNQAAGLLKLNRTTLVEKIKKRGLEI